MPTGPGKTETSDPRIATLEELALAGVTAARLRKHGVLLSLVGGQPSAQHDDPLRAEVLLRAFEEVAAIAQTSVHASKEFSKKNESAQVAAAAELLGLGDEKQFLTIFTGKPSALADFERLVKGATPVAIRKLRAAVWVGNLTVRAGDPDRRGPWFPAFLDAAERHIAVVRSNIVGLAHNDSGPGSAAHIAPGYVQREREEAEFHRLVAEGAKLVVFVGQAGMGKSTLANAMTGGTHFIPFESGEPHAGELAKALVARGLQPTNQPKDGVERLALLVHGPSAPRFVVLDGLKDGDELRRFVPRPTDSTIVATCRQRGQVPPDHCRFIEVNEMTVAEAAALALNQAPDIGATDAWHVARLLHCHPLIIRHFCAILPYNRLPVTELCLDIRDDARALADDAFTAEGMTLFVVLRRNLRVLANRSPVAFDLFGLLCCLLGGVPWEIVEVSQEVRQPPLSLAQQLKILEDFALLRIADKHVAVNGFIKKVSRQLFIEMDKLNDVAKMMILMWDHYAKVRDPDIFSGADGPTAVAKNLFSLRGGAVLRLSGPIYYLALSMFSLVLHHLEALDPQLRREMLVRYGFDPP